MDDWISHMDGCKAEESKTVAGNLETDGFYCLPPSDQSSSRWTDREEICLRQKQKDWDTRPNWNENLIFVNSYCSTRIFNFLLYFEVKSEQGKCCCYRFNLISFFNNLNTKIKFGSIIFTYTSEELKFIL